MMTHLDLYKESINLKLYQLSLVRIHFIYFWSAQLILIIFISERSEWLYFIIFKSIRRLNMILQRDFMIPIMNFYRIRDLHRDLRSIPGLSGKICLTIRLPLYLVLQTHDIVFSSRQSDHSHCVNDLASRFILKSSLF